jgi:hypothetical protein
MRRRTHGLQAVGFRVSPDDRRAHLQSNGEFWRHDNSTTRVSATSMYAGQSIVIHHTCMPSIARSLTKGCPRVVPFSAAPSAALCLRLALSVQHEQPSQWIATVAAWGCEAPAGMITIPAKHLQHMVLTTTVAADRPLRHKGRTSACFDDVSSSQNV